MKHLTNSLLALFILGATAVCILAQGGGGEVTKKPPPKPTPPPKPPSTIKTGPSAPPKVIVVEKTVPAKPLTSELTIKSEPSSAVLLNGKLQGTTDSNGYLPLKILKPGQHIVIVKKAAHREETRAISIAAGQSQVVTIPLIPLPGSLSIRPNVAGARIEIAGIGAYTNSVSNVQLVPGQYQVRVTKAGYRMDSKTISIGPAGIIDLPVTLIAITPAEMLAQAERDFQERKLPEVREACAGILTAQPNNARANTLMGLSYYYSEKYVESLDYLAKAISLGEEVTLPVKHHHKALMDDDLCNGALTFSGGMLSFNSQVGGHNFKVPIGKLAAVRFEPQKSGRISADVLLPKGSKDEKKAYNFHAFHAFIRQYKADSSLRVVDCNTCQEETELLYQLLVRSQQMPATINRAAQTTTQPSQDNTSPPPNSGTAVSPPSGFRTWGQKSFQFNYPASWVTALEKSDSIALAPQQSLTQVRGQMNYTHGVNAGVTKMPDVPGANLATVSETFILSLLTSNLHLQRRDGLRPARLAGRETLTITLSGFSNVSKRNETVTVYTTVLRNREFFYLLTVAPMEDLGSYQTIFQTILNSVQFKD